jgi:hypothetical protein
MNGGWWGWLNWLLPVPKPGLSLLSAWYVLSRPFEPCIRRCLNIEEIQQAKHGRQSLNFGPPNSDSMYNERNLKGFMNGGWLNWLLPVPKPGLSLLIAWYVLSRPFEPFVLRSLYIELELGGPKFGSEVDPFTIFWQTMAYTCQYRVLTSTLQAWNHVSGDVWALMKFNKLNSKKIVNGSTSDWKTWIVK